MAIRFVDVEPGKAAGAESAEARGAPARPARPPEAHPAPTPAADAPRAEADAGSDARADDPAAEAPLPGLTHAKPEPKPRGRKKPLSAAGADKPDRKPAPASGAPAAPLLDGLLPELQAHAKPTPKPRGRKKAFG